ncbi:TetR/AcrR family transcriptional regulator [Acinetobacter rathckeae]|uniref:TetR/AcrR family transcriptional regulator n=1 Tax=Acinetobacter rathckeae TaxID=2605272 RepID=UPI0018A25EAA|nr:TetR/AcrR family transcriptional regulator [Acinetobacter rathckeae]MBF7688831.1 TetR family transcriptional regulator C-terminal domain-containing protein [Acinetobacter rathckeae]MBF7696308.1 TetR family transcriptional regulator C-terminal domain-containing protein [Acinetobacter rathckeae]
MELKKSTQKRHQLLNAALDVFCVYGFTGASLDEIAKRSDMHKSNIFYYFSNKEALYIEVLTSVLQKWLESMEMLNVDENPEEMLTKYIESKLEFSRVNPKASKLFALEIIQGAPYIQTILKGSIKKYFRRKVKVIAEWQAQGKIATDIAPELFIMNLWSVTQSYADFDTQFEVLTGKTLRNRSFNQAAIKNNVHLLLHGALAR